MLHNSVSQVKSETKRTVENAMSNIVNTQSKDVVENSRTASDKLLAFKGSVQQCRRIFEAELRVTSLRDLHYHH